jgi:hypothetical protein
MIAEMIELVLRPDITPLNWRMLEGETDIGAIPG